VTGGGWQLGLFPDANPTRQQLDAVVPDRPAFFAGADGHSVWVNSRALTAAGVTAATPDPPGGRIERDANGEPSGTLRDSAAALIRRVMPRPTQADIEAGILRGVALAHQFGITSVHEANAAEIVLAAYHALDRRTALHVRVTAAAALSPILKAATDIPAEITRLERLRDEHQSPRLTVTAVKVGADGALESRTAALLEPYVGTTDRGQTMLPPDLFTPLVVALDRAKLPVHVHARPAWRLTPSPPLGRRMAPMGRCTRSPICSS
jgi:predicted amidohydrolase YtcJ